MAKLIEAIFQSFFKEILPSKISLPHPGPFKSDGMLKFLDYF